MCPMSEAADLLVSDFGPRPQVQRDTYDDVVSADPYLSVVFDAFDIRLRAWGAFGDPLGVMESATFVVDAAGPGPPGHLGRGDATG